MDDIRTAPRLSTHWSSFQNHTLQAKEEAESDKKLNRAPKACGGSGRLGELGGGGCRCAACLRSVATSYETGFK